MSHRTRSEVLNVRNECKHRCFKNYRSDNPSLSGCDGGCGYCGDLYSHDVLTKPAIPINELSMNILSLTGKKTWLYVLDFFDNMNVDIFEAMPEQSDTPIVIEGCVRTMYQNYKEKIELKRSGA